MPPARQLAFPFPPNDATAFAAFLPGASNAAARAWLERPGDWPWGRLALFGPAGAGKTHLLHLFAGARAGTLIPGEALRGLIAPPERGALAIDDADCAPEPETLLHLINAAAERRLPVLLAASLPPARWATTLPDLASRLRATTAIGLGLPEDDLLRALLARLLADRQLAVAEAVQDYLLARLPRTGAALREAACRLDRASLAARRAVTRAIAADVLAEMDVGTADEPSAAPSPEAPGLF